MKKLQSKIASFELRLRHAIKTLPLFWKMVFLVLFGFFLINLVTILYYADQNFAIEIPQKGGSLTEGIIGTPRFVNPVLAISDADRDLSALLYSGLMRAGQSNQLIPDMAENYTVEDGGLCYSFVLKPDIRWSDDEPITADDIIFTIDLIKNPQTKSPKRASWEGVSIEKTDEKTVRFCLPSPYSPFLENTTIGILPRHIWGEILPEQIPLSDFNINPIGSGPYKIKKTSRSSSGIITSYTLATNSNFALGEPYIQSVVLKFYPSGKKLIEAYQNNEIESMSAVSPKNISDIKKATTLIKTYALPRIFAVFFNQNNNPIFADHAVREALALSVDRAFIVREILKDFGITADGPLPPGTLGSSPQKDNSLPDENLAKATALLEKAGWKPNKDTGILEKKKSKTETLRLEFSLSTSNLEDLALTADLLKTMWEKLGVKVNIKIFEIGDLEQNVIRPRKYDTLLFGEIMGRDPDPFAFWHSSQRNDPGLNIALYANITADKLLENARNISETEKKEEKYLAFQNEIKKDIPAVFLYSPYFIYLLPQKISEIKENFIATPPERFSLIHTWYIETKKTWDIF